MMILMLMAEGVQITMCARIAKCRAEGETLKAALISHVPTIMCWTYPMWVVLCMIAGITLFILAKPCLSEMGKGFNNVLSIWSGCRWSLHVCPLDEFCWFNKRSNRDVFIASGDYLSYWLDTVFRCSAYRAW